MATATRNTRTRRIQLKITRERYSMDDLAPPLSDDGLSIIRGRAAVGYLCVCVETQRLPVVA